MFEAFLRKPFEKILYRSWDIRVFLKALSSKNCIFYDFFWHSYLIEVSSVWLEIYTVSTSQIDLLATQKTSSNGQNIAGLTNTTKYMTKLSFFNILCTHISQEQIMFKSWNFDYREISLSTRSDKKFSFLHSPYASEHLHQNRDFSQNHSFERVRSRAKRGL